MYVVQHHMNAMNMVLHTQVHSTQFSDRATPPVRYAGTRNQSHFFDEHEMIAPRDRPWMVACRSCQPVAGKSPGNGAMFSIEHVLTSHKEANKQTKYMVMWSKGLALCSRKCNYIN